MSHDQLDTNCIIHYNIKLMALLMLCCRKNYGMPNLSYRASLQQAAAAILQAHFAAIPAIPLSPHAHVLGSLTAKPAEALPDGLAQFCAQHPDGAMYISTGTSAIPGVPRGRFPVVHIGLWSVKRFLHDLTIHMCCFAMLYQSAAC